MQSKSRLPSNHSLDELIKSLDDNTEDTSSVQITDGVFSFLSYFGLEPGENLIPSKTLYTLYKKWSKDPLCNISFGLKISNYFQSHFKGTKKFWKINLSTLQVSEKVLIFIQKSKRDKTKYPRWRKHFEDYLAFYDIKAGKKWLQPYVLKHYYDKWCFNNNRVSLLSDNQFFNFCKLYFDYKRNTDSRMQWFGVSDDFMNTIPKQTLINLERAWNSKNGKKQKGANKVSRAKTRIKSKD